ncbi:hypothetical protein M7I_0548 [Glarea lozoyensis 74030]|uniref:Uncharacterized protein n=1 Tax=Glarea lozoyensis (strain ATCC 74030 / MF5533) TaxID=1104152 RepID=H0EDU1_GLAL7|nr:hypothetical protein M7I_0548 [Glarea lozoyensis 74030]
MLGPPPLDLLERGTRTAEFFDKEDFKTLARGKVGSCMYLA